MLFNEKLEYDFPIYWNKPMKLMDEMKDFNSFEGTVPLSRTNKKNKHLIDVIDRYNKFFSLILKNPSSYHLHVYFCKVRFELNYLVSFKMGVNYYNRFVYYHKVFKKLERDFFCFTKLEFKKFEFYKEQHKNLSLDVKRFYKRVCEVVTISCIDYRQYSLKNGTKSQEKEVLKYLKLMEFESSINEINYISCNIKLIETRISEECERLNAEETKLMTVSDPGLPPINSSIDIPYHGNNPSNVVSLPESKLSDRVSAEDKEKQDKEKQDKEKQDKEKPSAPSHKAESVKRNTDSQVVPSTQSNNPASSLSSVSPTSQDSMIDKEGSPSLSSVSPRHNPIKQLFTDKISSFNAFLQKTRYNQSLKNTILLVLTIIFFLLRVTPKGLDSLSLDRLPHLDSLMIVNPLVFISIGLSLIIMYLFSNVRKDFHLNKMIKLLMQVFFLYLVIYTFFEYTNLFQPLINAINSPETSVTLPSTDGIVTTSPTEGANNLPDEKKDIKQPEEKKEINLPEEKKEIDLPWYKKKIVWAVLCCAISLGFYYWSVSSSSSSSSTGSSAELSDIINRRVFNTYAENRDLERQVYAAGSVFESLRSELTTQTMLRDIVIAGDAARHHLSLMDQYRQDLLTLPTYPEERNTSILKGIIYLIGLRWAIINNSSEIKATGSDIVNIVLSQERPFAMDPTPLDLSVAGPSGTQPDNEPIVPVGTVIRNESISTVVVQTDNEQVSEVVEPNQRSISTQTSPSFRTKQIDSSNFLMDAIRYIFNDVASDSFDYETFSCFTILIYSVIIPIIITHGASYVWTKLNEIFSSSAVSQTEMNQSPLEERFPDSSTVESTHNPEYTGYPDSLTPLTLDEHSPDSVPPLEECSSDSATPHNQRLESTDNPSFIVVDNPIFRSTDSLTSIPPIPDSVPSDPPAPLEPNTIDMSGK